MTLTIFGLGVIYVAFIAALIAAGTAIVILVIAGGFALAQIFFGDKIALAAMRAKVTEPPEAPRLHETIERLCQLADLPKPRVAVAQTDCRTPSPPGTSKSATVCVTTGLMERLEPRELEGVLAHELSHIANKDVIVMTVAGFLATVAGLLVRFGVYSGMMGGRSRDNTALVFLVVVVASIVVYVLSFLLLRVSRYREFAADRARRSSRARRPARLGAAEDQRIDVPDPTQDLRASEGMNAFFILPAVARASRCRASSRPTRRPRSGSSACSPCRRRSTAPRPRSSRSRGPARRPARPAHAQARAARRAVRHRQRGDDARGRARDRPDGRAGVCFRTIEAAQFSALVREIEDLLRVARRVGDDRHPPRRRARLRLGGDRGPRRRGSRDHDPRQPVAGGAPPLGAPAVRGLRLPGRGRPRQLVYAYKRGTFYPFVPREGRRRDNALELRLQAALAAELPLEPELERWYPVWDSPVSGAPAA